MGAAMLVGRRDRSLAPRAFGRMGAPDAAPVRPDTIFAVASCTKPIVAAAVCLLVERGLVGLDQPLCELIPELSPNLQEARLSQLMTHTSGLGGLVRNRELRRTRQPAPAVARCAVPDDLGGATGHAGTLYKRRGGPAR